LLVSSAATSAAVSTGKHPRLLVTTHSQISQLRADGGNLAWLEGCDLRLYTLAKQKQTRVARGCETNDPESLTLTGRRVYWLEEGHSNAEYWWEIRSAAPHHRRTLLDSADLICAGYDDLGDCECYDGPQLGQMLGSGGTFVYDVYDVSYASDCGSFTLNSHTVYRVVSRSGHLHESTVPDPGDAGLIGYSTGRIATLSSDLTEISIRNVRTGALVSVIPIDAAIEPEGFAMSKSLAVITFRSSVRGGGFEWHAVSTGALLGRKGMGHAPDSLAVSGRRIVYLSGTHKLWLVPEGGTHPRLVLHSSRPLRDLQIAGRRVFWFKGSSKRARIYELKVR
jgi:hypothetical protein